MLGSRSWNLRNLIFQNYVPWPKCWAAAYSRISCLPDTLWSGSTAFGKFLYCIYRTWKADWARSDRCFTVQMTGTEYTTELPALQTLSLNTLKTNGCHSGFRKLDEYSSSKLQEQCHCPLSSQLHHKTYLLAVGLTISSNLHLHSFLPDFFTLFPLLPDICKNLDWASQDRNLLFSE